MSKGDKPTIHEVWPLVRELYSRHGAGCCLHIVLDDGNVMDDDVRFCIEWADKEGCKPCAELGQLLLRMSRTQRKKLCAMRTV